MVANGIALGDEVYIRGTFTRGEVIEIWDIPNGFAHLKLRFQSGTGEVEVWENSRHAAKILPGEPTPQPLTAADLRHIGRH